jgi:hypothetical protein
VSVRPSYNCPLFCLKLSSGLTLTIAPFLTTESADDNNMVAGDARWKGENVIRQQHNRSKTWLPPTTSTCPSYLPRKARGKTRKQGTLDQAWPWGLTTRGRVTNPGVRGKQRLGGDYGNNSPPFIDEPSEESNTAVRCLADRHHQPPLVRTHGRGASSLFEDRFPTTTAYPFDSLIGHTLIHPHTPIPYTTFQAHFIIHRIRTTTAPAC